MKKASDVALLMQKAKESIANGPQVPKTSKKKRKTAKEVYTEIRESLDPKPIYNTEEELIRELFPDVDIEVDIEKPIIRTGLWDYVLEDEITFFDPNYSYELTKYRPITATEGLDFNPDWFREAAILYNTTGAFTTYSKDSKPYIDFWNEQKRRCKEGFEVNGYRIPGDFYFFLNFYRLPVVKEENGRRFVDESFPVFTTEHYKWFHYVEMCELLHKDCCALKSRGVKYCAPI